jgi:NDP-sugar pyrophosphorylase family protein
MTILKNQGKWDKSNVFLKKNLLIKYNKKTPSTKMKYIDYGLSILSESIFDVYSNKKRFDLSSVFEALSLKRQIKGFEVYERFYEIGTLKSIKETEKYLNKLYMC